MYMEEVAELKGMLQEVVGGGGGVGVNNPYFLNISYFGITSLYSGTNFHYYIIQT